jgi:hypothetical protein
MASKAARTPATRVRQGLPIGTPIDRVLAAYRRARDQADFDLIWDVKVLRRQLEAQISRRDGRAWRARTGSGRGGQRGRRGSASS